jgi:signal transduction histidine kinase
MKPATLVVARAATWSLAPLLVAATTVLLLRRPDAAGPVIHTADLPYTAAILACWVVGVVLTWRVPGQVAGWAFLGLGTAVTWSAFTGAYADLALVWGEDLPRARLVAVLSDTSFVWWFVLLALALQFTPPRSARSWFTRALPTVTVAAGAGFQAMALMRPTPLEPPHVGVVSPWAVAALGGPIRVAAGMAVVLLGLCLLASLAVLVRAWRRAEGESRRQLLWLVAGAAPLAPCVAASFAVSYLGYDGAAGWIMSLAIISIEVGAALSVLKYRLYDVERVVTDSAAYALASATVLVAFGAVVVVISRTTPLDPTARLPTVLATLAGVAVARQSYIWARRAVDRRLNRRRFDAVELVRTGLAEQTRDLDALLAEALDDPSARVLYPAGDQTWVTATGHVAVLTSRAVDIRRHGKHSAKIVFDPERCDRSVVESVAREAAAEIDNVALRAELARQVELITESRARLASAHLLERRRIERDLHDGAQQRILAIALQLQAARLNGADAVLREEVDRAVTHLGTTVQELRDLAAGLQPAALAGGGLVAAVEDLAGRLPIRIHRQVVDARFPAAVEGAAWFVIAEAVSNAVKHAGTGEVWIDARRDGSQLSVTVADHGPAGADPHGSGLQGLADRVAALGGRLTVTDRRPRGTIVQAVLPCG